MAEMNRTSALGWAIMMVMLLASPALAHCFPDRTTPAAASVVTEPPAQVVVHFDNPFNPASTTIRVLNENGDVVSGPGKPSQDQRELAAMLKPLAPGQYFVKWRATSQDGDHTQGAYSFTVRGAAH